MNNAITAHAITRPDAAEWDQFVFGQSRAHLLQLSGWGALKSQFGWDSTIVALAEGQTLLGGALVLLKSLPLRLGKMAYVPMGPYVTDQDLIPELTQAIGNETGAAFLKIEPGHFHEDRAPDLASMGFVPGPQSIQPANTILIDIDGDDDGILKRMNQGTRRKIRKSQPLGGSDQVRRAGTKEQKRSARADGNLLSKRAGIAYYEGGRTELAAFFRLMQATGERNDFDVHSAAYYGEVYDRFIPDYGTLLMAKHDEQLLATIMVFALGDTAWYFYGASSRDKSNLNASYGLQWRAIQWAKARGCKTYDMWGIPDQDEESLEAQFKERSDGLWGVYGFKRGWGGEIRRSAGSWDLIFNPLVYGAYRTALKLRG